MEQEICRLCLSENNLKPIFVNIEDSERYSTVLGLTTGLKIQPNDGLPQQICEDCTESVNSATRLRNQSHLSHLKLLQLNLNKKTSQTENKTTTSTEKGYKLENNVSGEDSNDVCEDEGRLPDFQIEVQFQRMTDNEKIEKQDGRSDSDGGKINDKSNNGRSKKTGGKSTKKDVEEEGSKTKTMTRKERRDMYLELVDGPLDPKGPVRCKVCKKTVSKWSCFISHAKLHLGFKFMCEFCGKSFISSTQLKRHCRSHHGLQRELACQHCSYLALDTAQLVLHERRVHTGERPYVCDTCAARYHSRRCLLQHVETHRTTATVQCESCPLKFKSARHLARHRYSAHARKRRKMRREDDN